MLGTLIHGTHRSEDLIPCFLAEYRRLVQEWSELHRASDGGGIPVGAFNRHAHNLALFDKNVKADWDTGEAERGEIMAWDLEDLFDLLDEFAPPGYHFGAHEGDGSDFGFWKDEEEDSSQATD
tara:strand:- start:1457 stop:1825 length:369 start_codon:yes stop_codon:yes gene_type:complete